MGAITFRVHAPGVIELDVIIDGETHRARIEAIIQPGDQDATSPPPRPETSLPPEATPSGPRNEKGGDGTEIEIEMPITQVGFIVNGSRVFLRTPVSYQAANDDDWQAIDSDGQIVEYAPQVEGVRIFFVEIAGEEHVSG